MQVCAIEIHVFVMPLSVNDLNEAKRLNDVNPIPLPFQPRWYFFIALVSITFIGPLSLHLFIPALSVVKVGFGVSTGMAQLTMSLAMLSMAFFTVA